MVKLAHFFPEPCRNLFLDLPFEPDTEKRTHGRCSGDILENQFRIREAVRIVAFLEQLFTEFCKHVLIVDKIAARLIGIDDITGKYLPMHFTNFKIEGRSLGSALILEFLLYYMTKPEYQLSVREAVYLDSSLDLF